VTHCGQRWPAAHTRSCSQMSVWKSRMKEHGLDDDPVRAHLRAARRCRRAHAHEGLAP
jgi:hypothetical protein